jgi:hypothetical protein
MHYMLNLTKSVKMQEIMKYDILLKLNSYSENRAIKKSNTVGAPNRTVSVTIFITLAVSKREAYRIFCLKFSVFPLKKVKSANRTIFKIMIVLAF